MTYAIYQHGFASVRLSPDEAKELETLQNIHDLFGKDYADTQNWLRRSLDRYHAKLADIEKVARWKFENGHA